ncbi:MAG: hypothetical protein OSB09_10875 [Planctomycetota bacterium]|nr:hypothetical protein [Planctomycetota bacterium]
MTLENRSTYRQRISRQWSAAPESCTPESCTPESCIPESCIPESCKVQGRFALSWILLVWVGVVGCSPTPSVERVPIAVLRAQGAIHRTGSGETLLWIARDRGYQVIELESLNPRWKGVTIAPGTAIQLPMGKPKIRRIQQSSGGR